MIDVDARALGIPLLTARCLSATLTRGMGTGGEFSIACKVIEQEKEALSQNSTVLISSFYSPTRRDGGGATEGSAARDAGALLCLLSHALQLEKGRHAQAEQALAELRKHAMRSSHYLMILFYR